MKKMSISPIITALEESFDYLNNRFYEGKLERPVIVIAEGQKARAMGWFTCGKVWHSKDGNTHAYELNIASDYLDRSFEEVATTLAHEMVHCYDEMEGIKDCARSGSRHNKNFKTSAEAHGMVWVAPTDEASQADYKKVGYARVAFKEDVKDEILEALKGLEDALTLYRDKRKAGDKVVKGGGSGKAGVIKYICPCCGNSVRATKKVMIMCMDCEKVMVDAGSIGGGNADENINKN